MTAQGTRRQYGGEWNEKYLYLFGIALASVLITASVMSLKFFEVWGFKMAGSAIFVPFYLVLGDILTEVYGFRKAARVILAALAGRIFFMLSAQGVIALPPAPEWAMQGAFEQVFGDVPRLMIASCLAYLAGEFSNAWIMSRMKIRTGGRFFWLRAMVSTFVGEAATTAVFLLGAFAGAMPWGFLLQAIVNGTLLKVLIEALVLPLTTVICRKMKEAEGRDYFDSKPAPPG